MLLLFYMQDLHLASFFYFFIDIFLFLVLKLVLPLAETELFFPGQTTKGTYFL